jgi:hypothetical protein
MLLTDRYAQLRDTDRVRERVLFVSPQIPSELELQARWFAGDFGKHFISTAGDEIEVVQFGTWNREAGPDFRDAAIRINGGDPIRGWIEIDLLDPISLCVDPSLPRKKTLRNVVDVTECSVLCSESSWHLLANTIKIPRSFTLRSPTHSGGD